jgi:hypothetical protein
MRTAIPSLRRICFSKVKPTKITTSPQMRRDSDSFAETCLFFKGKNNKNNNKRSQMKRIIEDSDSLSET